MRALILAAGKGRRLRPLTREVPKPLTPILNKPVMEHVLELLLSHGISEVFVNLHYQAEKIKQYFGDGSEWGVRIKYSYEPQILGTAGGLKKLEKYFHSTFLVISGDLLTDIDLTSLIKFHQKKKALVTLALSKVDDPSPYGVALIDKGFRIVGFQEKPKREEAESNLVNCGIYVMEPEVLFMIPQGKFYDFGEDLFPRIVRDKKDVYGFVHKDYWRDVGNIDSYREGNFEALEGKVKLKIPGKEVKKGVWVGENSKIHPKAKIHPPVCIGRNCVIGEGVEIVGPSVIGDDCYIESGTRLEKIVKWRDGFFAPRVKVKESLIAESVVVVDGENPLESVVVDSGCFLFNGRVQPKELIRFELGGICFELKIISSFQNNLQNYFGGFVTDKEPSFFVDINLVPFSNSLKNKSLKSYVARNAFNSTSLYIQECEEKRFMSIINAFMHFIYQDAAVNCNRRTCLIHAAGIGLNNRGYLFVGPSGSGKSTIAQLISQNEPSAEILSDEMCIISEDKDGLFVYSTPFRGDYPGKRNARFPLEAIYFLFPSNSVSLKTCDGMKCVTQLVESMQPAIKILKLAYFDLIRKVDMAISISRRIPVFELSFQPDSSFWSCVKVAPKKFERRSG